LTRYFASPALAEPWCREARAAGGGLGLVPTMGALHDGHLALVRRSVEANRSTCVSIFVNPLQFDEAADFEAYPRDLGRDLEALERVGCDAVLGGTLAEFFPEGEPGTDGGAPLEEPGPCAAGLEGAHRPGHFAGVATIVRRLFELVRPSCAYFGAKDFQQTLVVRAVAGRLGFPDVEVCPTSREASGLARSSRNERLGAADRERALALSRALFRARELWRAGERDAAALGRAMLGELDREGVEPEYAEVRDPERWTAAAPAGGLVRARGLVAARVGPVRLIDNLDLGGDEEDGARYAPGAAAPSR